MQSVFSPVVRLARPAAPGVLPPAVFGVAPLIPNMPSLPGPMIPMAVPKKRTSYSKSRKRLAGKGLKNISHYEVCPSCKGLKLFHHVCPKCTVQKLRSMK